MPSTNGNGNGKNGHTPPASANGSSNGTANGHRPGRGTQNGRFTPARYAHIIGWGMETPATVITNADLEAVVETNDEWIRTRTGIHERRFANERETVTTLGFEAARKALDRANTLPSEIDLIIVATSTPENFYPSTASQIQNLIGASAFRRVRSGRGVRWIRLRAEYGRAVDPLREHQQGAGHWQ